MKKNRIILEIPQFDGSFHFNWKEQSKLSFIIKDGVGELVGNSSGLLSLANHLINLAQENVYNRYHIHLDEFNSLEKGSVELIIEKNNDL